MKETLHKKIVILGSSNVSTRVVYNALASRYSVGCVVVEDREPIIKFIKRRIKRLGFVTVLGQLSFQVFSKLLTLRSKGRIKEIVELSKMDLTPILESKVHRVSSVNDSASIEFINQLQPDLLIVTGTRILSKKFVSSVPCKIMNVHAGITPRYRGVHGMYWALVNADDENSGVTVHFVDEGIDTGGIIEYARVIPSKADNFATYPLLQLSTGLNLLVAAIDNYFSGNIEVKVGTPDSFLWYHPTLWLYLKNLFLKGVK